MRVGVRGGGVGWGEESCLTFEPALLSNQPLGLEAMELPQINEKTKMLFHPVAVCQGCCVAWKNQPAKENSTFHF